jgi:hypothetical protein
MGAKVRRTVEGANLVTWRGAGPGARFDRGRTGAALQVAARRRLRVVGLLDPVRTMDEPPDEADEAEAAV